MQGFQDSSLQEHMLIYANDMLLFLGDWHPWILDHKKIGPKSFLLTIDQQPDKTLLVAGLLNIVSSLKYLGKQVSAQFSDYERL